MVGAGAGTNSAEPDIDPVVDVEVEPLGPWAWQRATSAAVGVLTAAMLGSLAGIIGTAIATTVAAAVAYVVGPVAALIERRRGPLFPAQIGRYWGGVAALAVVTAAAATTPVLSSASDWVMPILIVVLGLPVAIVSLVMAVLVAPRLPVGVGHVLAVAVPSTLVALGAAFARMETSSPVPGMLEAFVILAAALIVPLTLGLTDTRHAVVAWSMAPMTAVAVVLGPTVGMPLFLAAPAVIGAIMLALVRGVRWLLDDRSTAGAVPVAATGFLAFASLWLVAHLLGLRPGGFGPPYVVLTTIHFVYAGFVTTMLAWLAWRTRASDRVARTAVATAVAGPPIVAAGFAAVPLLQVTGAVIMTVATYATAWVMWRHVRPTAPDLATRSLFAVSAASVVVPMVLAVQWAVGHVYGTPALSVPQMAWTHGLLNALGFCLFGVLGWWRLRHVTNAGTTSVPPARGSA